MIHPLDYPAADGRPVTQRHADVCARRGHAVHTVNGKPTGACPRCGEVYTQSRSATPADTQRDRLALGARVPAPCASCSGALTARLPHRVTRRAAGTVELTCECCGAADAVPAALAGRLMAGE